MAELIKSQHDLATLKLSLAAEVTSTIGDVIVCEVERGAERIGQLSVPAARLGLPQAFEPAQYRFREPPFTMPADLGLELAPLVDAAVSDGPRTLWLHFASPSGFLPLMPWERMLQSVSSVPVLRIPNFTLFPSLQLEPLDIVLCVSEPKAKQHFDAHELIGEICRRMLEHLPFGPTIHIFADAETHSKLGRSGLSESAAQQDGRVVIYDPAGAPTGSTLQSAINDRADFVTNPWLLWILQEMAGTTVEAVHFISHGYLAGDQSALALAEAPNRNDDTEWAHFIGPAQLRACVDRLGAWAVGLSSPPSNLSPLGSRLFADQVANMRAGPVILHAVSDDPSGYELADAYYSLFARHRPPKPSSVGMYCHPRHFLETSPGDEDIGYAESLVSSFVTSQEPANSAAPWVTLITRSLEQSTARLFPADDVPSSAQQIAAGEGIKEALSFIDDVIRSLNAAVPPGDESDIGQFVGASAGSPSEPAGTDSVAIDADEPPDPESQSRA